MIQDLRHSFRVLLQGRMVTLIAVLALGLGIRGANTAIFSVVNAVLLSPLPYRDPGRLVTLLQGQSGPISPGDFFDFRRKASTFETVGAAEAFSAGLNGAVMPEQIVGLHLTAEMFPLLGVAPVRGRTFAEDDFHPGKDRVLVISHRLWQSRFGGAADIIGRKVLLDNEAYTVVGVMGPEFRFAPFWITTAEMWAPLDMTGRENQRGFNSIRVFARLKPGVNIQTAQADVGRIVADSRGSLSGDERGDEGEGGIARREVDRKAAAGAGVDARRGGDGAADCVRECRQSCVGACDGAAAGDRDPDVAGRAAAADRAAVFDREPAGVDGGCGAGTGARAVGTRGAATDPAA